MALRLEIKIGGSLWSAAARRRFPIPGFVDYSIKRKRRRAAALQSFARLNAKLYAIGVSTPRTVITIRQSRSDG